MKWFIVAVGHRMPPWINAGFDEYARRMPRDLSFRLVEIKPETRSTAGDVPRCLEAERRRIEAALPPRCFRVALDEHGRQIPTQQLATWLAEWRMGGRDVAFLIGGADGLAGGLKEGADMLWSLSTLTLPHGLVRVLVAEQLYRAWSIVNSHPYHRS
jgi:23S rRNA (pseudouridine1915-N3)-methyltransferase